MFEGKTFLVTGATQGIGRAISDELFSLQARLILVARSEAKLEFVKNDLLGRNNSGVVYSSPIDLTKDESSTQVSNLLEQFGQIDGVVANVGSGRRAEGSFNHRLRNSINKNLFSAVNTLVGSLPFLRPDETSSVVATSSIAAQELISCPPEYAASKAALEMLTKHWSSIYAPIRFNCVAPGNVLTENSLWAERFASDPQKLKADLALSVPLSRLASPSEIASAVRFLLSEESSFMTGSCLKIDGGQTRTI